MVIWHRIPITWSQTHFKYNFVMKCHITILYLSTKGKVSTKMALVHLGPIYTLDLHVPHYGNCYGSNTMCVLQTMCQISHLSIL